MLARKATSAGYPYGTAAQTENARARPRSSSSSAVTVAANPNVLRTRTALHPNIPASAAPQPVKPKEKEEAAEQVKQKQPVDITLPAIIEVARIVRDKENAEIAITRKFRTRRVLGRGGFATCYELIDCETRKVVAGKVVPKASIKKPRAKAKLLTEIRIHKVLNHPHVVKFEDFVEDDDYVYIIMELCPNKTLMHLVRQRHHLTEPEARYYMLQIIDAVKYLHSRRIIHRDLKLGNLFLTGDLKIKIGDFGLAAQLKDDNERKKTICGTPNYIAPEILNEIGHSYEVDVWSLGVILYTLLVGVPPFETNDVKQTYARIRENSYNFPDTVAVSDSAKSLIQRMLNSNPELRPTLDQITEHRFFQEGFVPRSLPLSALHTAPSFRNTPGVVAATESAVSTRVVNTEPAPPRADEPHPVAMEIAAPQAAHEPPTAPSTRRKHGPHDLDQLFSTTYHARPPTTSVAAIQRTTSVPAAAVPNAVIDVSPSSTTPVHVTGIYDVIARWGLAYSLNNGSVGAYYNDGSRHVLLADLTFVYFPGPHEANSAPTRYRADAIPALSDIPKKTKLLMSFHKEFRARGTLPPSAAAGDAVATADTTTTPPHVARFWQVGGSTWLLRLTAHHSLVQAIFADRDSVVIDNTTDSVTYLVPEHGVCVTLPIRSLKTAAAANTMVAPNITCTRVVERIHYVYELLALVSTADGKHAQTTAAANTKAAVTNAATANRGNMNSATTTGRRV